jgi:hypothetical protein
MTAVQAIPIELIRTDGGTQIRDCKTMQTKIEEYVLALHGGADFPPLTVFWDGEHYWLADGFHRHGAYNVFMQAFKLPGLNIPCEVIEGDLREAIIYACGANAAHGMPRTNPDKQNAVKTMLTNPLVMINLETGKPWNNCDIARRCCVSDEMVRKHRAAIFQPLEDSASKEDGGSEERTVKRGGTTYTMKTDNIGSKAAQPKTAAETPTEPQPETKPAATADETQEEPSPAPEVPEEPARTAEIVQFTTPHDYLYDVLAEIDRLMKRLPEPDVAAAEFPSTLAHALTLERVVDIKHWWLDFTRFWSARQPEFLSYQRRQLELIKEELNERTNRTRPR